MPRNFDEERDQDLDFVIRGEKFTVARVRPEVIGEWEDEATPEKSMDAITYTSDKVKGFILNSDGSHERWDAVRKQTDDPVTLGELNELLVWMIQVQSARPTQSPSPSAAGRGRTAASSKGA